MFLKDKIDVDGCGDVVDDDQARFGTKFADELTVFLGRWAGGRFANYGQSWNWNELFVNIIMVCMIHDVHVCVRP